jgi:hypothetical protein
VVKLQLRRGQAVDFEMEAVTMDAEGVPRVVKE